VIAVATGTTAIIATTQDGGKTAICNITVSTGEPPTINVESIGLNKTTDTLQIGDSVQLTATILPTNATNQNITWVSTVPTVATVVNGKVKTLSVGTTSIIATTQDGGKTAICNITVVPVPTWCNDFRPEFGASLGTVEFLSSTVWTVGNQEWSDIVTASNCAKTTFNPSTYDSDLGHDSYNADCRADKPSGNYYYSWCAVHRFANVLCPSGWRVPTDADFAALDKVLKGSGNGTEHYTNPTIRDKYLADWGGKYTGHIEGDGELADSDFLAMYWSSVQASSNDANVLYYDATGLIYPQIPHGKGAGLVLRCVRNK
jgi:uncharacterized protein (TIGR02145 family)